MDHRFVLFLSKDKRERKAVDTMPATTFPIGFA